MDDLITLNNQKYIDSNFDLLLGKFRGDKQAEEALKNTFAKVERAKQEWESTVDALPELICVVDDKGQIIRTNRTVEAWGLGKVVNVRGQDLHKLVHPECVKPCLLNDILKQVQQDEKQEKSIDQEFFDSHLQRFIRLRVEPVVLTISGVAQHIVVILQDITLRKRVEQALQQQNNRLAAVNAINHAILAAESPAEIAQAALNNIRDRIPYQQAHVLVHLPKNKEFLVLAVTGDINNSSHKAGQKLTEVAFSNNSWEQLAQFFTVKTLTNIPYPTPMEKLWLKYKVESYISIPLIAENNFIGVFQLASGKDESPKPQQIEIIREVAETLTIAIYQSQLNQKLKASNEELQELLRAKHEMLENVSHELRSPLALIKGYTELLREGLLGPLTTEQLDALAILDSKGDQLFFLVNRLFTLQTVTKHSLNKVEIDAKALLQETVKSWEVLSNNNNIRLQLDAPEGLPPLKVDINLLNQVVTNLLDNAFKFSPKESTITIRANVKDRELIISIEDQGIGIPSEILIYIFDRFFQVEKGGSKAKSGAGIGLALCKAIVQAHEGRLWAESKGEGQGSAFYLSLPIENGAAKNK